MWDELNVIEEARRNPKVKEMEWNSFISIPGK